MYTWTCKECDHTHYDKEYEGRASDFVCPSCKHMFSYGEMGERAMQETVDTAVSGTFRNLVADYIRERITDDITMQDAYRYYTRHVNPELKEVYPVQGIKQIAESNGVGPMKVLATIRNIYKNGVAVDAIIDRALLDAMLVYDKKVSDALSCKDNAELGSKKRVDLAISHRPVFLTVFETDYMAEPDPF